MEEDKVNPNSQSPSPLPGWLGDEALSGQWLGAGGGSGLPLPDTGEEGAFAYMDEEWESDTDEELSQYGEVPSQEPCLREDVRVQEFYQQQEEVTVQEVCPCGAVRLQEWRQWQVGARVHWGDGTQQELYHREESETVQELYPRDQEDETYQELSQWEEDQTVQDLSLWEGEGYHKLSPSEGDGRGRPHRYQREGDKREALGSSRAASPAPGSPTEDEPAAAAAAGAGAAEEVEEPPEPLAPEVGKAPGSPAGTEKVPSAGTESPGPAPASPRGRRQSLWDFVWGITCEIVRRAWLVIQASGTQPEEQRHLEQSTAAELEAAAPGQRQVSPTSAPQSPCCSPSPSPSPQGAQVLSEQQEEADRGSVLAEEENKTGEIEHSPCKDEEHPELSQGEINKCQEGSQGEPCSQQEISLEAGSYHKLSDWDERTEEELSHGNVGSYQEASDWEESMGQELSEEEDSNGQEVSRGNGRRPSVQSSWENDSDQDLAQDSWEQSIGDKPLLQEEDEWDEVSVIELWEESREQRLAGLAGGGLPLPVPREAWVEHEASELYASPPHPEALAPTGHTASPAFEEQVPEAGTQSPEAARRCHPRFSVFRQRTRPLSLQLGRPKKRTSILRRALHSLFCWPCLAPQPQD